MYILTIVNRNITFLLRIHTKNERRRATRGGAQDEAKFDLERLKQTGAVFGRGRQQAGGRGAFYLRTKFVEKLAENRKNLPRFAIAIFFFFNFIAIQWRIAEIYEIERFIEFKDFEQVFWEGKAEMRSQNLEKLYLKIGKKYTENIRKIYTDF